MERLCPLIIIISSHHHCNLVSPWVKWPWNGQRIFTVNKFNKFHNAISNNYFMLVSVYICAHTIVKLTIHKILLLLLLHYLFYFIFHRKAIQRIFGGKPSSVAFCSFHLLTFWRTKVASIYSSTFHNTENIGHNRNNFSKDSNAFEKVSRSCLPIISNQVKILYVTFLNQMSGYHDMRRETFG